ncbi:MAG: hypothetical protein Q7K42_03085, partial [Candidatus Diapherotrites archaeon]|nr:hypothetical protein [Candidatus Diapherotrites archaeon]
MSFKDLLLFPLSWLKDVKTWQLVAYYFVLLLISNIISFGLIFLFFGSVENYYNLASSGFSSSPALDINYIIFSVAVFVVSLVFMVLIACVNALISFRAFDFKKLKYAGFNSSASRPAGIG